MCKVCVNSCLINSSSSAYKQLILALFIMDLSYRDRSMPLCHIWRILTLLSFRYIKVLWSYKWEFWSEPCVSSVFIELFFWMCLIIYCVGVEIFLTLYCYGVWDTLSTLALYGKYQTFHQQPHISIMCRVETY